MAFNSAMANRFAIAAAICFCSAAAMAVPVYTDPDGGNLDITFLNPGGAAGDFVTLIPDAFSVGTVKLGFWVFTLSDEAGYFYTYQLVNINAGSIGQGPGSASLRFFELFNIAPHTVLGLGGGKHGGAVYTPWLYVGDNLSTATWVGTGSSSIDPGETSPAVPDTAEMYQIHSLAGPGSGVLYIATSSGGGYTGQSVNVWVPVPEPGTIAGLLAGGLGLWGLSRRRK